VERVNPETPLMQRIRLAAGARPDARLFRNNTGVLLDRFGRPVRYGLCTGSSDLIGWRTVELGGRRVAVFTAIEVKLPLGRLEPAQRNFIEAVKAAGGIAGVARSPLEAKELLDAF
jgi:hypothetical protein